MTEQGGFTEPAAPAPAPDSAGLPEPAAGDDQAPAPEPVTEAPSAAPELEPVELTQEGEPDPVLLTQEPPAAPEVVSPSAGGPDPVLPPFIPDAGVPPWLAEAIRYLHDRLRNLGG